MDRAAHHALLLDVASIPTAAGREHRVIDRIHRWVRERPDLSLRADEHGNLEISFSNPSPAPLYFTAHLDHPAFVVERAIGPATVELSFRGGVMDDYFPAARIRWHGSAPCGGTLRETIGPQEPFKRFLADLDHPADARPGDIVTWDLPHAEITHEIDRGMLHAPACDDLAAVAAALCAYDELRALRSKREEIPDVRLLFTRAEEIGFVGAIGACRSGFIPAKARLLALENSRAMSEAPIGAGPIVRVGDRVSVFTPALTDAVARRAEQVAGGPPPTSAQKLSQAPRWKWQRKLMAGGACEASVFCAFGYEATCICLPLGNYHNMADLDAVQAGSNTAPPHVAREFISIADFDGLVDLLVACGQSIPASGGFRDRLDKLWDSRRSVLKA